MAPFMNVTSDELPIHVESNDIGSNGAGAEQMVDYSQPGSNGYSIPQNTTWNDSSNRKIRVLTIGAGISGILMAYQIQKQCQNVEHVIYEKNKTVGGKTGCWKGEIPPLTSIQVHGSKIDILAQVVIFLVMHIPINSLWCVWLCRCHRRSQA